MKPQPVTPIYTADLFLPRHRELIALLRSLGPDEWQLPTVAGDWRVRDVVAHLLDGHLRRISMQRDGHTLQSPHSVADYGDLVRYLSQLNAEWVQAAERLSPTALIELLEYSGPAVARAIASVSPHAPALLGVAWTGEQQSEHWMDTGREYTERWHHQVQIWDAVRARHPGAAEHYWSGSGSSRCSKSRSGHDPRIAVWHNDLRQLSCRRSEYLTGLTVCAK